jgi:hypothetical protein
MRGLLVPDAAKPLHIPKSAEVELIPTLLDERHLEVIMLELFEIDPVPNMRLVTVHRVSQLVVSVHDRGR